MDLNKEEKEVLQLIRNDSSQRKYFFQKLADTQQPYKWLESLKEEGYFDAKYNPAPEEVEHQPGFSTIPRWQVLGYLENIAKRNSEDPKQEITDFLVDFIDEVIKREEKKKVDNCRTNSTVVQLISYLPQNEIVEKHINFVSTITETKWKSTLLAVKLKDYLIPRLLSIQAKDLLLKLLQIILNFKDAPKNSHKKYIPMFERFWLKKTLDQHSKSIGQLCGVCATKIGISKIKELAGKDKNEFSVWRIRCVEDHEQRIINDEYAYLIVDFVRDTLLSAETEAARDLLVELLIDSPKILRRIAFHTINRRYNEFGELFWRIETNPLEVTEQKHEIYELLQNNCKKISETQIKRLTKWIETKDYYVSDEAVEDGNKEKMIAWRKKEWFFACKKSGNPLIKESFDKYDKFAPGELKHPGWSIWHESLRGRGKSPIIEEDLLSRENREIVQYINDCDLPWDSWDGPSKEGLVDCLNKCVSKNPDKFCINSEPFLEVERQFQQAILRGFCNARREKIEFDVGQSLDFMGHIIKEEKFWKEQYKKKSYNYRSWIISQIAEFVSDILRDKDLKPEENLLKQIKEILLLLIEKTKSEKPPNNRLIDSYINDSRGKVFESLIEYALQYARRFEKNETVRWEEEVKNVFEKGLKERNDWCLYVTFGRYLPWFMRLDKNWTEQNIENLFPKSNCDMWKASFVGYLNIHTLYTGLYELLKKHGNYDIAIKTDMGDEWTNNYLVQSISLAYMLNLEDLQETSLMIHLISREDISQLREIINYIWTLRDDEHIDDKSNNVKNLWRVLFGVLKIHTTDGNYQQMIINIGEWLGLIDYIDKEIEEWVKFTIDHVNEAWELSFFVEHLLNHVENEPERVANIYVYLLNRQKYPDFPEDKIIELVENLYLKKIKQKPGIICTKYLNAGFKFLRPTFQKYQQ